MPSTELTRWKAFYEIEPFGRQADDIGPGIIATLLANIHRDTKKRQKPFRTMDFVPDYDGSRTRKTGEGQKQSVEDMRKALKAIHAASRTRAHERRKMPKKKKRGQNNAG